MTATVSGATSCTLTTKPLLMGYPKTIKPCTSFTKSVKLPANTTATPKFYTLKLSATGGGSTVKAATMAVVLGKAPPASSITVSGALTKNTLLSPGLASVYLFSGQVSIPSGLTLTVAPGTIVKFENCGGCYLDVQGALRAVGTSTSPITFTSIDDNSVGGATGSGSPTTFDWGGISVGNSPGTPVSSIDLEQSTVEWTGSTYGKAVYVGDHSIGTVSSIGVAPDRRHVMYRFHSVKPTRSRNADGMPKGRPRSEHVRRGSGRR